MDLPPLSESLSLSSPTHAVLSITPVAVQMVNDIRQMAVVIQPQLNRLASPIRRRLGWSIKVAKDLSQHVPVFRASRCEVGLG